MKKYILAASLILSCSATIHAESNIESSKASPRDSSWHRISIYNLAGLDVAYVMRGATILNTIYGIKNGNRDIYHAKDGDTNMLFLVGKCTDPAMVNGEGCQQMQGLQNCTRGVRYNADRINSITIDSLTSCTINCEGGGSTSCRA